LERDPLKRISFERFFAHPFVDMEHIPGPESLCRAVSRVLGVQIPGDARRKEAIRAKVGQYISRAEELKALVTSSSKNLLQQGNPARALLKEMAKDKPRLCAALEVASAAIAKEEEGKDDGDTLELYQQSLGELLLLLAAEPAGRRRELLHAEIQTLMARAEYLKDQLKMREAQSLGKEALAEPVRSRLARRCPNVTGQAGGKEARSEQSPRRQWPLSLGMAPDAFSHRCHGKAWGGRVLKPSCLFLPSSPCKGFFRPGTT
ncbi:PREDICTED: serine/threonine-protein kinase ULK3, partial [Eurypyga helias]|uniref:serine/threonine-protein kinase ULK3 n=1 Tax=Eurypyga helias TaxID=54383 RepID=UPI00052859BE